MLRKILALQLFSLFCISFAAENIDLSTLMGGQNSGGLGAGALGKSSSMSSSEQDLVMRMILQERSRSAGDDSRSSTLNSGRGNLGNDSSSLFLNDDSLLAAPSKDQMDTMTYILKKDTISVDSLRYQDSSIVKKMGLTKDRRQMVVMRKIPYTPKKSLTRYDLDVFAQTPASLFGSTTNGINGNYPIKPGDDLVLTIWGEVEKEYPAKVNNQGKVMIEGIGLVSLNNTNLGQAEEILKVKLGKIYSGIGRGRTFVNLRLEKLSPIKIFVLGEVGKPGGYVFYGNTSVFQALYLAGGPSKNGSVRNVQITRSDTVMNVDLYEYLMKGIIPEPSVLHDGDIVFLPRASILAGIKGDVGRPGIYELKTGESVKELLSFSGQVNATAASQKMVMQRILPDGRPDYLTLDTPENFLKGTTAFPVQDGDTLQVFASSEKSRDHATIIGAVKYPGTYQLSPDMKVTDLLTVAGGMLEETYQGRLQVLRTLPGGGFQLLSQSMSGAAIALLPRDTVVVYSMKDLHTADSVTISGAVAHPGRFEFLDGMAAKDLILKAGGFLANRQKGTVRLEHVRKDSRGMEVELVSIQDNYEADANSQTKLKPWDHMEVPVDPNFYRPQKVKLAGAFKTPGEYSLLYPGEKMKSLIERAGMFQEDAYLDGAQFFRNSDSIGQIGFNITDAMAGVATDNIQLQNGDSIWIPIPKVHIRVVGEVGYPCNVLYKPGKSIAWYITQAGGFRASSDLGRVMIRYANGAVSTEFDAERDPDPGSMIIVPYKEPPPAVNWYQVASTAATILGTVATLLLAYAALNK